MFASHKGDVDLVVSDVVMPEMDGPTLFEKLRAQRPDLKVIFISGYAEDAFRRHLAEPAHLDGAGIAVLQDARSIVAGGAVSAIAAE